jgi:glycosyltransferase involved in cell wall biosynthesis
MRSSKFKQLKVSALIVNYNNQDYLDECLDSIKNQTYNNQDIEIIFHDDCSSDNSLKKIKKYKNVKIIENKTRGKFGSFNQMNAYYKAFKKSKGDIIFFLDSDDFFEKNKIKTIANIFLNKKKYFLYLIYLSLSMRKNRNLLKIENFFFQAFGLIYHHKVA